MLLTSGMTSLVDASLVPKDAFGNDIVGGLFCVLHKALFDRLINDRRPLNAIEQKLNWIELPHGSMLTQLVVGENEVTLGWGDDLSNFFYCFR